MNAIRSPSTAVVSAGRICPRCGAPIGGFGPEGLCGACMFDVALLADEPVVELDLLATGSRRFGDYELLEEIARGGMGVIFKARHLSLNRIVALKMILRGEFASVADLARFRAEAETSGRLQHPNIVAIHEVGEREGQPFFSMDYVKGQNLAQIVGDTPLTAVRAAKYLKTVTEAIQYAHQQGVLHRDLKPSNVLIDANDQPRVTDFGLAKRMVAADVRRLTSVSATERQQEAQSLLTSAATDLTITGQILGSPNFMPPEQAAGKHHAIGPASDVYSLGAILYHALTGRPPFVAESVTATLRLVAETEPVSPRLLVPTVPPDLETICLKCLQKEPPRRYATARELAEDLNRFLGDEPIRARPASQAEKMWRWCRRKPALASAVALLLVVAIGSPVAAVRINRARQQAEAGQTQAKLEASRSKQIAQFLQNMLKGVGPSVALGRDTTMLREILDQTAWSLGKELQDQPGVEAELRNTLGLVYHEIGEFAKAETMHREALTLRKKLLGEEHLDVANSLNNLAMAIVGQRNNNTYGESEILLREALTTQKKLLGNEHALVADSLSNLGHVLWRQGRFAEAETMHREALAIRRKLFGAEHVDVATSLSRLGLALYNHGKIGESEVVFRDALAMRKRLLGNEHPDVATSLYNLSGSLGAQNRMAEDESLLRESLAIRRKILPNDHVHLMDSRCDLAALLFRAGKDAEAEVLFHDVLDVERNRATNNPANFTSPMRSLVNALVARRKDVEVEQFFTAMLKPTVMSQRKDAGLLSARGDFLGRRGWWKEAAADLAKAIEFEPANHFSYHKLAPLLVANGDLEEYRQLCQQMQARFRGNRNPIVAERMAKACLILPSSGADLRVVTEWCDTAITVGKSNRYLPYFIFAKGLAEFRLGNSSSAGAWMQESLAGDGTVGDDCRQVEVQMVLAMTHYQLKHFDEARAALATGNEIAKTKLPKMLKGDFGEFWMDCIIARVLMREARELIEGIDPGGTGGLDTKE